MTTPLISVILPTHNRKDRIGDAVRSVLAQTYQRWELVVVDDGSTDATHAVVSDFEDERIHYHYQDNRQLNGARNKGVSLASGDHACFLDDDDRFLDNHLEVLVKALNDRPGYDLYRSGLLLDYGGGKIESGFNYANDRDALVQFWEQAPGMFGILFPAELLRANPFAEEHLLLDDFLWLNRVLPQQTLHQIDAHTAVVNVHPDQRSAGYLNRELLEKNLMRLAEAYNRPATMERVPFTAYQARVLHQYMHYARQMSREGNKLEAARAWKIGVSYARLSDLREVARTAVGIPLGR